MFYVYVLRSEFGMLNLLARIIDFEQAQIIRV